LSSFNSDFRRWRGRSAGGLGAFLDRFVASSISSIDSDGSSSIGAASDRDTVEGAIAMSALSLLQRVVNNGYLFTF
jgi:hypothetical protein